MEEQTRTTAPGAAFDAYAANYDEALNQGLSISGERKEYFAQRRVDWLAARLRERRATVPEVMDFGCGPGSTAPLLLQLPGATRVVGVDASEGLLDLARQNYASSAIRFESTRGPLTEGSVDLVYCNGVFHHIPPAERGDVVSWIRARLRPGGWFALWENNPWSPATRYVMHRIPFDRDAVLISTGSAARMLRSAGFQVEHTDYLFLFPRWLAPLRAFERHLGGFPLGAQYLVLARRE